MSFVDKGSRRYHVVITIKAKSANTPQRRKEFAAFKKKLKALAKAYQGSVKAV